MPRTLPPCLSDLPLSVSILSLLLSFPGFPLLFSLQGSP